MLIGIILLVILILALVGIIPIWPHSRPWGYFPCGRHCVAGRGKEEGMMGGKTFQSRRFL